VRKKRYLAKREGIMRATVRVKKAAMQFAGEKGASFSVFSLLSMVARPNRTNSCP
jgi:hypothetical protein